MTIYVDTHLSLSQITLSDAPVLVKYLSYPPLYENTLMIPHPYTMREADCYIHFVEEQKQKFGRLTEWAIRDEREQVIGGVGFHLAYGIHSHKDVIGYWLAAPFWGQGIMTKVIQTITRLAFGDFGLIRIEAPIFPHNVASGRVLQKCGFVSEGILQCYHLRNGSPIDVKMYARIKQAADSVSTDTP